MAKVSVIVAAYNVEEYISDALNSLVAQTLKDIEIVVVDDCSTDGTLDIIEKFAALDDRIKVVKHEVNKSVNVSRPDGVRVATGEYVMFLDADDMLKKDACEKAYNAIVSENVDMLQFDIDIEFTDDQTGNDIKERDMRNYLSSVEHKVISVSKHGLLDENIMHNTKINYTFWNKIYNKKVLEKAIIDIPNDYLNTAEDVLFSIIFQYYAKSFSYLCSRLYIYRFGSGMTTSNVLNDKQIYNITKNAYVYKYIKTWCESKGIEKNCINMLERVHTQLYDQMLWIYLDKISKSKKAFYINEILKYGTVEDFVLAVSNFVYRGFMEPQRVSQEFAGLEIFASHNDKVKTVGTFYFRMFNGGVENVISSLTDIWVKTGYNVVLFTDKEPNKDDFYINPKVKRIVIPEMVNVEYTTQKNRIEVFRKKLIENNVDVMVYNAWVNPHLTLDSMIVKSCGVNFIVHTHSMFCCEVNSYDFYTAKMFMSMHSLLGFADCVVTLTDVDTAWWKMMGLNAIKTVNPIQYTTATPVSKLNGKKILFVARISPEKNIIDAIKIAEAVSKECSGTELTIVGKGDDAVFEKTISDYISQNKLNEVVNMVGFHTDMRPFYRDADVVLSTSKFEGFGLVLMESKMCGIPLVMYELPNLDITRNAKGMIVVPQSDIEAAAHEIVKLFKDDIYKKEIGRQARESAEEFYSIDLAKHWQSIFELSVQPPKPIVPLYKLSAEEVAVRMAVEYYRDGIIKRGVNSGDTTYLSMRCAELEHTLEEFRRSESYRIGMIITFIPRKIKALLKKIFKRKKQVN